MICCRLTLEFVVIAMAETSVASCVVAVASVVACSEESRDLPVTGAAIVVMVSFPEKV